MNAILKSTAVALSALMAPSAYAMGEPAAELHVPSAPRQSSILSRVAGRQGIPTSTIEDVRFETRSASAISTSPQRRAPLAAAPTTRENVVIYGGILYASDWSEGNTPFGMYEMRLTQPIGVKLVAANSYITPNGGGIYKDGIYYFNATYQYGSDTYCDYEIFDATTWEEIDYKYSELTNVASDMTIDPTSDTVYGCFYNDALDGFCLGTFDLKTGTRTFVADLPMMFFMLAASTDGTLYGVGSDNVLYKIGKRDGTLTKVGDTGLKAKYLQTGVYDAQTDAIYWLASLEDGTSGIYELDKSTGAASPIGAFANDEEVAGAYIIPSKADPEAPGAPANLTATFDGISRSGSIAFTLPTKTYSGGTLAGEVKYTVTANDEMIKEGTAEAGADVTFEVTMPKEGLYTFRATASNAHGSGIPAEITKYVGADAPAAVGEVTFDISDGGLVTLSWGASTVGAHGGNIDPAKVQYKVIRHPGDVEIAVTKERSVTDNMADCPLALYRYEVIPFIDDVFGEGSFTAERKLGEVAVIPFTETFDTEGGFGLFTYYSSVGDDRWMYNTTYGGAVGNGFSYDTKDDWMISPAFRLEGGKHYRLSFDSKVQDHYRPELMEVRLGRTPSPEGMTTALRGTFEISNKNDAPYEAIVAVSESGIYHIGLHLVTEPEKFYVYIDNFSLSLAEADIIAAPADLKVAAGAKGAPEAIVEFTAPGADVYGRPISEPYDIAIMQGDKQVGEIKGATPGTKQTVTVTECLENRYQSFHAAGITTAGTRGFSAVDGAYIGFDIPGVPLNARLKAEGNNAVITWDKPSETGIANGYVDTDNLTYYVQRAQTEEWVAYGTRELTVTDFDVASGDKQEFASYFVYAMNEVGVDLPAMTNGEIFGKPYPLPFKESFADAKLEMGPWALVSGGGTSKWSVTYTHDSQDDDLGCTYYTPGETTGDCSTLSSAKITLNGSTAPVLSFYYYNRHDSSTGLSLMVGETHAGFREVKTFTVNTDAQPEGWTLLEYPLGEYINVPSIQFGIKATTEGASPKNLFVDNIRVEDKSGSGMDAVTAAEDVYDVYSLDGICVARGVSSIRGLRAGIYLVKSSSTGTVRKIAVQQ